MNNLEVFEFEGNKVRTQIDQDGNVWFRVKDVCEVLGVKNYRDVVAKLEKDDVDLIDTIDSLGRTQSVRYTNESGLYDIVLQSRKPEARKFRRWVTSEVLPSIRKTGSYSLTPPTLDSYQIEDPILRAQKWIEEQKEKVLLLEESKLLNARLEEVKPKEEFYDAVMIAENSIDMKTVANVLNCGLGRNQIFELLRDCGIVNRKNEPQQRFINQGLFEVSIHAKYVGGVPRVTRTTYVTPKGLEYISKLIREYA